MRNLKRALSLALASVMVMGLMVVGTACWTLVSLARRTWAMYVKVSSKAVVPLAS